MSNQLEPADFTRCQTWITPAHSFMTLGPKPRPVRCTNEPAYLVRELRAGVDGLCGQMTMCLSCYDEFVRLTPADYRDHYEIKTIAQVMPLLENPSK